MRRPGCCLIHGADQILLSHLTELGANLASASDGVDGSGFADFAEFVADISRAVNEADGGAFHGRPELVADFSGVGDGAQGSFLLISPRSWPTIAAPCIPARVFSRVAWATHPVTS